MSEAERYQRKSLSRPVAPWRSAKVSGDTLGFIEQSLSRDAEAPVRGTCCPYRTARRAGL